MKEWTVFDEVFPFICENSACKKGYNNKEFTSAALKWGYIFLTNDKYNFIGLTCPSCRTTTIHKYSLKTSDLINKINFQFRCFVPFFVDDLPDLNKEDTEDLYHVPDVIQKLNPKYPYPQWFEEDSICNIYEKDFNKIIDYENKNYKQVFPRIITTFSIYNKTDGFLSLLKSRNAPIDNLDDMVLYLNELIINIAKDNYLSGPESNITEDEYKDINILYAMANDYGEDFVKTIPAFLDEYIQIRNNFDFEISYKTDFLDKYIKQFYYLKGYYGSEKFYDDKAEYEEMFGKQFKGGIKAIDDSSDQEILSHKEVLQRWDRDINILKKFVMSRDLPAYDSSGVWFDPLSPEAQHLGINPKNYIYLKSEVEELEIRKPWLSKDTIESDDDNQQSLNAKERREFGQLKREKEKWDASIKVAVEIGIFCQEQNKKIKRAEIRDKAYEANPNIHDTTIEKIWKAIPKQYRSTGGRPKKSEEK